MGCREIAGGAARTGHVTARAVVLVYDVTTAHQQRHGALEAFRAALETFMGEIAVGLPDGVDGLVETRCGCVTGQATLVDKRLVGCLVGADGGLVAHCPHMSGIGCGSPRSPRRSFLAASTNGGAAMVFGRAVAPDFLRGDDSGDMAVKSRPNLRPLP